MTNKAQLIQELAADPELAGYSKTELDKIVNKLINTIMHKVASGEEVSIIGVLNIKRKLRPARTGRNPKNGEVINIPEAYVVGVKIGAKFKKLVNESK
ncbi:MAG: HU family DNA-binding protein [Pseudomonadota bacterium]|nr:HU family DNA-binding protein [Pseudomonadota bacterium]